MRYKNLELTSYIFALYSTFWTVVGEPFAQYVKVECLLFEHVTPAMYIKYILYFYLRRWIMALKASAWWERGAVRFQRPGVKRIRPAVAGSSGQSKVPNWSDDIIPSFHPGCQNKE